MNKTIRCFDVVFLFPNLCIYGHIQMNPIQYISWYLSFFFSLFACCFMRAMFLYPSLSWPTDQFKNVRMKKNPVVQLSGSCKVQYRNNWESLEEKAWATIRDVSIGFSMLKLLVSNFMLSHYVSLFFTVCVLYTQGMGNKEWREVSVYHRAYCGHLMARHQSMHSSKTDSFTGLGGYFKNTSIPNMQMKTREKKSYVVICMMCKFAHLYYLP